MACFAPGIYGTVQTARVSEEEERRHFEEQERAKRDSLVSAVEDKIRRQLKQTLETSQVLGSGGGCVISR